MGAPLDAHPMSTRPRSQRLGRVRPWLTSVAFVHAYINGVVTVTLYVPIHRTPIRPCALLPGLGGGHYATAAE
jgi:hypothetical protein